MSDESIRRTLGWVSRDNRRCGKCDYDLTGLQDTRCPECGTPFGRGPLPKLRPAR